MGLDRGYLLQHIFDAFLLLLVRVQNLEERTVRFWGEERSGGGVSGCEQSVYAGGCETVAKRLRNGCETVAKGL